LYLCKKINIRNEDISAAFYFHECNVLEKIAKIITYTVFHEIYLRNLQLAGHQVSGHRLLKNFAAF
jgi:hypothetical protein